MKRKSLSVICGLALALAGATPAMATTSEPAIIVADVALVRPACLVATVIGSAFFVVSLPLAAMSHSIDSSAKALVIGPAEATFTRRLGDVESLADWE